MLMKKRTPAAKVTAESLRRAAVRAERLARELRELGIERHASAVDAAAWTRQRPRLRLSKVQPFRTRKTQNSLNQIL